MRIAAKDAVALAKYYQAVFGKLQKAAETDEGRGPEVNIREGA